MVTFASAATLDECAAKATDAADYVTAHFASIGQPHGAGV